MHEHQTQCERRDDRAAPESGEQVAQVVGDLSAPRRGAVGPRGSSGVDGADVDPGAELFELATLHATQDLLG